MPEVLIGVGTFTSTSIFDEFAKLHAFCANLSMCLKLLGAYVPSFFMFIHAYMPIYFLCLHAYVHWFFTCVCA